MNISTYGHRITGRRRAMRSIVSIMALSTSHVAMAQESFADDESVIVVTARNRSEKLADVPLSITAETGQALERRGVEGLRDLAYITPGVTIRSTGSEHSQRPVIRGQGDISGGLGDPNVSIFLDGVYMYNSSAVSLELADIERVEVVKGPVSALYGRNASAGAINYVTTRPGDALKVKLRGSLAEDGYRVLTGSISGPIIPGILSLGVAGHYGKFNGSYRDQVNGKRAGGYEKKDFQVKLAFTPTDGIRTFSTWYRGDDSFGIAASIAPAPNCGIPAGGTAASPSPLPAGTPGLSLLAPFNKYCGEWRADKALQVPDTNGAGTGNTRRVDFLSHRMEFDIADLGTLTTLTGYNKVTQLRYNDSSGGQRNGFTFALMPATLASQEVTTEPPTINLYSLFGSVSDTRDFSQEIRFQSPQDLRFRWQAGGFYYDLKADSALPFGFVGTIPAGQAVALASRGATGIVLTRALGITALTSPTGAINRNNYQASSVDTKQKSIFAAADFDLVTGVVASAEGRQTWEKKRFTPKGSLNFFGPNTIPPIAGFSPIGEFDYFDYRLSLKYTPMPGLMTYASMATGTKGGGFNTSAAAPGFESEQTFAPERNKTYEIGAKFSTWSNRLQLSIAGFRIDTSDAQFVSSSANPANGALIARNLASVRTYGFEADMALRPMDGVRLNLGLAYADPKIGKDTYQIYSANPQAPVAGAVTCALVPSCAPSLVKLATVQNGNPQFFNALNIGGNQTPATSKWQVTAGFEFDGSLTNDWNWFARADYRYESRQFNDVENYAFILARNLVNLRAGVRNDRWSLTAYVENLTNNQTPEGTNYQTNLPDLSSTLLTGYLPIARQIGVTVGFDF